MSEVYQQLSQSLMAGMSLGSLAGEFLPLKALVSKEEGPRDAKKSLGVRAAN